MSSDTINVPEIIRGVHGFPDLTVSRESLVDVYTVILFVINRIDKMYASVDPGFHSVALEMPQNTQKTCLEKNS